MGGVGGDLHDLELTDEGTALIPVYKIVPHDLTPIGAYADGEAIDSVIQEVDVETGRVRVGVEQPRARGDRPSRYAGIPQKTRFPYDYFHINSIDVDSDGNLLVSARNTWAIYKIDRATGEVIWRLGGLPQRLRAGGGRPLRLAARRAPPARRHADAVRQPGDAEGRPASRAADPALDERTHAGDRDGDPRRTPTASSRSPRATPSSCPTAARSSASAAAAASPSSTPRGRLRFDLRFPKDVDSYRGYRFAWRGEPAEPPRAVATRSGDAIRVAASWNGATEVTDWEVLAGPAPDALVAAGKAHRRGFETAIPISTDAAFVAVRALAGTRELGPLGPRARRRPVGSRSCGSC